MMRAGVDEFGQSLDVCAQKLFHSTIVKDIFDDGGAVPQLQQHLFRSNKLPRLCFLGLVNYLHFTEENIAYLLRR